MSAPTLHKLIFKRNSCGDYDVYESHRCQEKGCFWTDEEYLTVCLPDHIDEFVEEYNDNLLEGTVDEVDVVK